MATREELYRHFGPKLNEVILKVLLNQINVLRNRAELSEISQQQALDALENEWQNTPNYDWMD